MRRGIPHLPAEPLYAFFDGADDGVIADALGVSRRTVVRWRREGIRWPTADLICTRVDLHPLLVWGNDWLALIPWDAEAS